MASRPSDFISQKYPPHHPPPILYHYCSTDAFYSIIKNKTIRLSALSMSNDSEEGKLILRLTDLLGKKENTLKEVLSAIKIHWNELVATNEGLGFCLSESDDLLSQWRGYADQGRGVAIGFSSSFLQEYPHSIQPPENISGVRLAKVEYDEEKQKLDYESTYKGLVNIMLAAKKVGEITKTTIRDQISVKVGEKLERWTDKIYTFKNYGFAEEREWRMLTLLSSEPSDKCFYRSAGDKIIAFKEITLPEECDLAKAIESVTLGPKHSTPANLIERMLRQHGSSAKVTNSKLTYR